MPTLHEEFVRTVTDHEAQLASLQRPELSAKIRKARAVHQVFAVGAGALGLGAVVGIGIGAVALAGTFADNGSTQTLAMGEYQHAIVLNPGGAPVAEVPADTVVVDVYLDAMCPICARFATEVEPQLLAMDGATVVYHPVAILDQFSSDGTFSTRAASAIQEVLAGDPEHLQAFLTGLWAGQPAEGTTLTDEQLMAIATEAGVNPDIVALFPQVRYADDIAAATAGLEEAGIVGTPTIIIDGVQWDAQAQPSQGDNPWASVLTQVEDAVAAN